MKLFSVFDVKAKHFNQPFMEKTTVNAIRGFEIAVNESESIYKKFPDDFALMELAEFDVNTGKLTVNEIPVNLGSGRSLVRTVTQ